MMIHEPGQAGYETDADESELSEWESGSVRQGQAAQRSSLLSRKLVLSLQVHESLFICARGTKGSWKLLCVDLKNQPSRSM